MLDRRIDEKEGIELEKIYNQYLDGRIDKLKKTSSKLKIFSVICWKKLLSQQSK